MIQYQDATSTQVFNDIMTSFGFTGRPDKPSNGTKIPIATFYRVL
jgi:hypothetical protein